MTILLDKNTRVLVQGITGNTGRTAARLMADYGTKVVAGVTPGKGGQEVEGVPVYNSVKEAIKNHPEINFSTIFVPPFAAKDSVMEAVSCQIKMINVLTEGIAINDTLQMLRYAQLNNCKIIGPSSIGIISSEVARLGVIGGNDENLSKVYKKGSIGVISRSGGMTNETAWVVRQAGLGQSTVVGIGGDLIIGTDYVDLLRMFEHDEQTKGVVIFGEPGGTYEEKIAEAIRKKEYTKPLAAFVAGKFVKEMPEGMKFGHAGAIIEGQRGLPENKIRVLKEAGILIAERHDQLGNMIKEAI